MKTTDGLKVIGGPELSVIAPTFNELNNVAELVRRLSSALTGISWEVIFVDDDSPDGTADVVRQLARSDARIRCVHRIGRRGLSSACVEGMLASTSQFLAVIDADLQHDEQLLPRMLDTLKRSEVEIVVASRYTKGGSVGTFSESRQRISRFAANLSRLVVRADLTDPMSGYFMLERDVLSGAVRNLSGYGFKILLDLFASSPRELRFQELPYTFRSRHSGESKLDSLVIWDYGMLLLDKTVGRYVPARFVAFSLVGAVGIAAHMIVLALVFRLLGYPFLVGQAIATLVAMTFNYAVNNILTYRDIRLSGWRWLRGWGSFVLACSVGALANVGIASYLFESSTGWIPSAIAGIAVGAVWNYAVTATFTWGKGRK